MNASMISDRRALRLSTIALLGIAALAACDTDRSVGPNPTTVPVDAALAKSPSKIGGKLVITIVGKNQQPVTVTGAQFTLAAPGQAAITAIDNGAQDADPVAGVIQVKGLTAATYDICETTAPTDHVLPTPNCASASVPNNGSASLTFVNLTMARVQFGPKDNAMNFVGGASFGLIDTDGKLVAQFADNAAPDLDRTWGRFELKFAVEGTWLLCLGTPPAGHVFYPAAAQCFPIEAKHGEYAQMADIWAYPYYSAAWAVTNNSVTPDGYYVPVGPSTFTVGAATGGFTTTIVDNGANDYDQRLGMLAIKLPGAGGYSICETVPPAGHKLANPACKRVDVKMASPAWAAWFINLPI